MHKAVQSTGLFGTPGPTCPKTTGLPLHVTTNSPLPFPIPVSLGGGTVLGREALVLNKHTEAILHGTAQNKTTFPSPFAGGCGHMTKLWPMGCKEKLQMRYP